MPCGSFAQANVSYWAVVSVVAASNGRTAAVPKRHGADGVGLLREQSVQYVRTVYITLQWQYKGYWEG